MFQVKLPKVNTIGIRYIEGVVKPEHYGNIIVKTFGVPMKEVHGIDDRTEKNIKNGFIFKVKSYERYKDICSKFSGREILVERGYRIRVEDISSDNTRVCISRVSFEVSNNMLKDALSNFGEVYSCENYHHQYGIFKKLEGTGNRVAWMKLSQHIPQVININQTLNYILVKYPGQEQSCHKCGDIGHVMRNCVTPTHNFKNKLDVNINIDRDLSNPVVKSHAEVHVDPSHNRIDFACDKCSYTSMYKDILDEHMQSHIEEEPYHCGERDHHMGDHTEEEPYKCNVCGESFRNKNDLEKHCRGHVGQYQLSGSKTKKNNKKKSPKTKKSIKDTENTNEICELFSDLNTQVKNLSEKPFGCSICSSVFTTVHEMTKHMCGHTKGNSYKCRECDFRTPSENTLKNHTKNHFCKRFICTECDSKFSEMDKLSLHMKGHTDSFNCPECDHKFSTRGELTLHKKCHTVEKLLDMSFASISDSPVNETKDSIKRGISTSPEGRPEIKKVQVE